MFLGEDRGLPESGAPEITAVKSLIVQDPGVEHGKVLALLANIRIGCKGLRGTSTLAYCKHS